MSYQDLMQDPEQLEALLRRARCERSEAVYRLIFLPIKRLLTGRRGPAHVPGCAAHA